MQISDRANSPGTFISLIILIQTHSTISLHVNRLILFPLHTLSVGMLCLTDEISPNVFCCIQSLPCAALLSDMSFAADNQETITHQLQQSRKEGSCAFCKCYTLVSIGPGNENRTALPSSGESLYETCIWPLGVTVRQPAVTVSPTQPRHTHRYTLQYSTFS